MSADSYPTVYTLTQPRARKTHKCYECGGTSERQDLKRIYVANLRKKKMDIPEWLAQYIK